MTFNLRFDNPQDGDNAWPYRRACAVQAIRRFGPDLLGVQEALAGQVGDLQRELPDYAMHGVGRDDGRQAGEFAAILYRRDRFEPLDAGHFWLSEQPDAPGSRSWDSERIRMASWLRLRDRDADHTFTCCNTHWDHFGPQARLESARLIRRRFDDPTDLLLLGDFNCHEDSEPLRVLLADDYLHDAYRAVHPRQAPDERTSHGFQGLTEGSRIDFVLHGPSFRAIDAIIDRTTCAGRYPSDHYPVAVILEHTR